MGLIIILAVVALVVFGPRLVASFFRTLLAEAKNTVDNTATGLKEGWKEEASLSSLHSQASQRIHNARNKVTDIQSKREAKQEQAS